MNDGLRNDILHFQKRTLRNFNACIETVDILGNYNEFSNT